MTNDAGRAIDLSWRLSPDDSLRNGKVTRYQIERSEVPSGPYTLVDSTGPGVHTRTDQSVAGEFHTLVRGPWSVVRGRSLSYTAHCTLCAVT